ncbi:MAG: oligosaccharide flippase family protein [Kordiimonadaceae bacterium]|nr:oligosaccharide flippase family protein [Kordiimonadaceae bacterium]
MLKVCWTRKLSVITCNQMFLEVCVFLRNIIIARLIGAETLGEFIFLVLSIRFFAMSTDLAVDRFILQTEQSSINKALAGAHFIIRTRSCLLAVFLLIMGLLSFQGISASCYIILACGSCIRGFTHQGYRLKQRHLDFRPALYVEGFSAVLATFAMYATALYFPTLEAMCFVLLAQSVMHTVLSHLISKRPYYAPAEGSMLRQQLKFGLPLMCAGIAMFWSMQGERIILSTVLSAIEFAHFSMVFQLALVPILIAGRIALTLGLPLMANHKGSPVEFSILLTKFQKYHLGGAGLFVLLFIAAANPVLMLLFGADFKADLSLVALVAVAQGLRLIRIPHSVAAQAFGQTDIPFKANIIRVLAVPIAALSLSLNGSLTTLLGIACVGEVISWAVQRTLFLTRNSQLTCSTQRPNPPTTINQTGIMP